VLNLASDIKPAIKNLQLKKEIEETKKNWGKYLDNFEFNNALISIWSLISFCDKEIEKEKPWQAGKEEVISNLLFAITEITELLKPFLPETSEKILEQIKNKKGESLFPRI